MKTWRKMCNLKGPTTNTPPDLRHPWSRKTFSLCRHKTKGQPVCLFKKKARFFEKFKFRAHSISNHIVCLPRNKAKSHCAWQQLFMHVGLLNFFIEFCLFFVFCWKQIFESVLENLNTFQSFRNKHCVLCTQPGNILILIIHTMADTWSMKYFRVLLKNFSSFVFLRGS